MYQRDSGGMAGRERAVEDDGQEGLTLYCGEMAVGMREVVREIREEEGDVYIP